MSFEDQLRNLADRKDLADLVAAMPEGSKGYIVYAEPMALDQDESAIVIRYFGHASHWEASGLNRWVAIDIENGEDD